MGLLSLFKRSDDSATEAPAAAAPDAVAAARTRARQRLIGATVLLGIGVIGFPLLFETQPRPIPVDIPIEIPRKDGVPPLALPPPAAASAQSAEAPAPPAPERPGPAVAAPAEIVERAEDLGRESTPARAAAPATLPQPAAPKAAPPRAADDGSRAQALLDGQAASASTTRLVVQVGAYADADKLRDARQKVEKLGLKTYVQVIEVDGAKRTRVRVGPFSSRAEADQAAARIKAAGLPVAVLSL